MVLVGRLRATDALGERRHSELLSLELELESKNISCFLGWPTVDGEDVGLPEDPEDILCKMTTRVVPVALGGNTADPMSLRCNSVQAATALALSRMALWYYVFFQIRIQLHHCGS